jgi:peroxiredoxin
MSDSVFLPAGLSRAREQIRRRRKETNIMAAKKSGSTAGSLNKGKTARGREGSGRSTSGAKQRNAPHRGFSRLNIVGSIVTVLVVLAIFGWAVFRSYAVTTPNALANPNALNPASRLLAVGSAAPDFTLRDVNGTVHHLAGQRGHPVLLEYFAVWCPVCRGEAPIIAKLTNAYTPKGIRVWSVLANPYGSNYESSGRTDLSLATKDDLAWFARTYNVKHPQLIDPQFQTVNRYGIYGYPGLYVVDPNGKISYVADNHESYGTLSKQLDRALATRAG